MENTNVPVISAKDLNLWYGDFKALKSISLDVGEREITALIGPSGCGKSTFLKTLNRMNDLVPGVRIEGDVRLKGEDIFAREMELTDLRRRVGMVFQKANPFPMSIYDNITYGPKLHGVRNKAELDELVESSLRGAALWDEVKDRLKKSALGLSGGQQQRLCIARALAVKPEVLLMDEPTSALDPGSTMKVEELMSELKKNYTVVIVTHNMQQAARISDNTAFFLLGELVESSLRGAALWDEVKDRLKKSALGLSGGQQQRLCIARALAVKPEVLLMDEPTSALDPGSTMKVEELMNELKKNYTVVIVTHNMQQAARISDRTAFFLLGELVEVGPTNQIFSTPRDKRTEDYISGRFG